MKVTHRITVSAGLLLALLIAVTVYNVVQLQRLVVMEEGLAHIDVSATSHAFELNRLLDDLESTSKKLVVLGDPGYAGRLTDLSAAFEAELGTLLALPLKPAQREPADRLAELWSEMPLAALSETAQSEGLGRADQDALTDAVDALAAGLREQAETIGRATQEIVTGEAAAAVEAGQRAATLSKLTMVAVVTVSLPLLLFTLASIREPLRRLREGTRSVSEGAFDVELDAEGDDEFSGVAASFNEMVRRLGELDRLKREFLSHVSHELRAPLAAMQETNRALLDEVPGELNAKQKRLLELNLQSNDRLSSMIGKLLDLARLEEGAVSYDLRPVELTELVQEVTESFGARAAEKGMLLELETPTQPVVATCDRDRIIQVVGNLLENAIKFSPNDGRISIATLGSPRGDGRSPALAGRGAAIIQISDSGPGVPDEHKEQVFARFHQVGGPNTSSGGVGLGLAICREIATAHRGAIWVEDNEGTGSVFCLALPLAGTGAGGGLERAAS